LWAYNNSDYLNISGWTNLYFCDSDLTAMPARAKLGFTNLINVESLFFTHCGNPLCISPSAASAWENLTREAEGLVENGTVAGFFVGDELCWNGLPYDQLLTVISTIRSSFPSSIIYYNEAYPVFTNDVNYLGQTVNYSSVPSELDWISIDIYPDFGTFQQAQNVFIQDLYPKMSPNQRAIYVPPTYATSFANWSQITCGTPTPAGCEEAMILWANQTFTWARSDPHLIGLLPWHWDSFSSKYIQGFEIGLDALPNLKAVWEEFALEVLGRAT